MLTAYISGQARRATVVHQSDLLCWDSGSAEPSVRSQRDFDFLFAGATDLRRMECADHKEVRAQLEKASNCDDALAYLMLVLDRDVSDAVKSQAIRSLDPLLADEAVQEFLWNRFAACPLPPNGTTDLASSIPAQHTRKFLRELALRQSRIAEIEAAWDQLPATVFLGLPDAPVCRSLLREAGFFGGILLEKPISKIIASVTKELTLAGLEEKALRHLLQRAVAAHSKPVFAAAVRPESAKPVTPAPPSVVSEWPVHKTANRPSKRVL